VTSHIARLLNVQEFNPVVKAFGLGTALLGSETPILGLGTVLCMES